MVLYSISKNGLVGVEANKVIKETPKTYVLDRICSRVVRKDTMSTRFELFYLNKDEAQNAYNKIRAFSSVG